LYWTFQASALSAANTPAATASYSSGLAASAATSDPRNCVLQIHTYYDYSAMPATPASAVRAVREVWAWNLHQEFLALLSVLQAAGPGTIAALDTEFPGVLQEGAWKKARNVQYKAMKDSVDLLNPIQLGLALASANGRILGAWTFNLLFDLRYDLHTDASVNFLSAAGIDFPRHACEGIDSKVLGAMLSSSPLVSTARDATPPAWLTFSGSYDLGYLLKLLSPPPLPRDHDEFDAALARLCPQCYELRDWLPFGSLQALATEHGVARHGTAHTAGSDALVTLELFLRVGPPQATTGGSDGDLREREVVAPPVTSFPSLPTCLVSVPAVIPRVDMAHPEPGCPSRASCSAVWGATARLAMKSDDDMSSSQAAPRALWGAAAREAVTETRISVHGAPPSSPSRRQCARA